MLQIQVFGKSKSIEFSFYWVLQQSNSLAENDEKTLYMLLRVLKKHILTN